MHIYILSSSPRVVLLRSNALVAGVVYPFNFRAKTFFRGENARIGKIKTLYECAYTQTIDDAADATYTIYLYLFTIIICATGCADGELPLAPSPPSPESTVHRYVLFVAAAPVVLVAAIVVGRVKLCVRVRAYVPSHLSHLLVFIGQCFTGQTPAFFPPPPPSLSSFRCVCARVCLSS